MNKTQIPDAWRVRMVGQDYPVKAPNDIAERVVMRDGYTVIDSEKHNLHVHDGVTPGGHVLEATTRLIDLDALIASVNRGTPVNHVSLNAMFGSDLRFDSERSAYVGTLGSSFATEDDIKALDVSVLAYGVTAGTVDGTWYTLLARGWVQRGVGSGAEMVVIATGPYSASATLTVPASSTLVSWDLKYRKAGSETWLTYATGITDLEIMVIGLDPSATDNISSYEFLPTVVLSTDGSTSTIDMPISTIERSTYAISVLGSVTPTAYTLATPTWYSYVAMYPPFAGDIGWDSIDIFGYGVHADPVAPTGIWLGRTASLNNAANPTITGMLAATGLKAPPAGTVALPGYGPLCDTIPLSRVPGGVKGLCLRIGMPAGNHARFVNGTTAERQPYGMAITKARKTDISADPTTGSGWEEAFGSFPLIAIRYNGLTRSVIQVLLSGDSHMSGYVAAAQGARGVHGWLRYQMDVEGVAPPIVFSNFAHAGQKSAEISAAMRSFVLATGVKNVMRERATVNDRTFANTYTQTEADAAFAILQSDYLWCAERGVRMVVWEGFGGTIEQPWYPVYRSRVADCIALVGAENFVDHASLIINPDGTFMAGTAGADGGHPESAAQLSVAIDSKYDMMAAFGLEWARHPV